MRVLERLEELYAIGGGVGANRVGGTGGEDEAHELAAQWMEQAGLQVEVDAAGNLIGRAGDAGVWTGDPARGHRVASRIKAGTVGINMPYTAFPGIPFGGYKQSGFGRELGLETLELYLETKSVIVNTSPKPINPFRL